LCSSAENAGGQRRIRSAGKRPGSFDGEPQRVLLDIASSCRERATRPGAAFKAKRKALRENAARSAAADAQGLRAGGFVLPTGMTGDFVASRTPGGGDEFIFWFADLGNLL